MRENLNGLISTDFTELKQFEEYINSRENCFVGWVDSFNDNLGTINVQPAIQNKLITQDNSIQYQNKPFLINCWVVANTLNRNPRKGDKCLVMVLDEKSNNFFKAQYDSSLPLQQQTNVNTSKARKSTSNCVAVIINPNFVNGGSGDVKWGDIGGDIKNQTDLYKWLTDLQKDISDIQGDYVTLDTEQTIPANKTFSDGLTLPNNKFIKSKLTNGNDINLVGIDNNNNILLGQSGSVGIVLERTHLRPFGENKNLSLGASNIKFNNLYLAGNLSDGTNNIKISDIQDKNDNIISAYGTCSTASATSAKVVTIADTNWQLKVGTIIGVKFTNSNSASNVTLNVNNTGAKSIWFNNTKYTGNNVNMCGQANRLIYYMYDGTYWVWLSNSVNANTDTIPAISWTVAGTADKTASYTGYQLLAKSYFNIVMGNSNTAKSKLTLNVNGKGSKPIYINGKVSSTTNYTLPAGSYFVYYDGTNYYFNTDGTIYGQQKFYDWVATDITLTTSTSNSTIDLSQYLPSTSGDEEYEILVQGYFENNSGTVGSRTRLRLYTDKIGSSSNPITIAEGLAQVRNVTYVATGNIIVSIHRYLYTMPEILDTATFKMYGYRRIK